jgi:Leucine-rich repeat (LRR) protein
MLDSEIDYSSITELNLSHKGLTKLPDLSKYVNLIKLDCSCNKLRQLDNLSSNLEILHCEFNYLQHLDNLPKGVKELYCENNQIIK